MSITLRGNRTRRVALDALLISLAIILSYVEVLLPLNALIPLPGFKLGLANLVVLVAFCRISTADAAVISTARILLMGLLFGSIVSLYFSVMGGLLSFLMMLLLARLGKYCSFFGVCVLCAAMHNCGQLIAAATLYGFSVVVSYLPVLLIASVIYGGIVGSLLNLIMPKLDAVFGKERL